MSVIPMYEDIVRVPSLVSEGGEYLIVVSGVNGFVYSLNTINVQEDGDDGALATVAPGKEKGMYLVSQLLFDQVEDQWNIDGIYPKTSTTTFKTTKTEWWKERSKSRQVTALCNLDTLHVHLISYF